MIENTEFRIEEPDLTSRYDVELIRRFLLPMGFYFDPAEVEYSVLLYTLNDEIIGVGSVQGKIMKYVAVAPSFRETGAFARIVTHLTEHVMERFKQAFVFTRPENITRFAGLGYKHIVSAEPLISVMEFGYKGIDDYKKYLKSIKVDHEMGSVAGIVMNCNPFTLGHQYLVEKASAANALVYLFVVEEDRSVIPFVHRWEIIKKGIAHLPNVVMVRGDEYIVSSATFPNYFLKNESPDMVTQKQAELDIRLFCEHIVPVLGIQSRYVGTEKYCATTKLYNRMMRDLLPANNITFVEVPRKKICDMDDGFISATKVREAIRDGREGELDGLLPVTTLDYIHSDLFREVKKRIQETVSRH
ncbi:MAG: [citrate (pro-3S)-lyase] ligase [Marinilabiliaceae bacterium]|nr:[citrate (pro-3S)-lyase] ligase [Marinilabiliaceae bacterium]